MEQDMAQTASTLTAIDPQDAAIAAEAATRGDLSALTPEQRTQLYGATCRSMGLNPLTQPFQYLRLNGKLTLYASRTATDQLRKLNGVSITHIEKEVFDGVLMVTVHAKDRTGREDTEIGAVSISGLKGEALANAHMKAITKAKRRVTLSISGLGWLDETEVETIPAVQYVPTEDVHDVDQETGEVRQPAPVAPPAPDWEGANKLLHATAEDFGFSHDDLHNWAVDRKFGSVKNATEEAMRKLAKDIRQRPDDARKYFEGLRAPAQPEPVEVSHRPINTAPPTQDELDAVEAMSTPTSVALPGVSDDGQRSNERFLN